MEELVESGTSEMSTAEDWSVIIQICEHAEGSAVKAKEIVNAIIKRLLHKNVNVVLYSLTLSNALVQNCSLNLKQEIASRPFQSVLLKLLNNERTHAAVRNRVLDLIQSWTEAFRGEPTLDYMGEIYRQLLSEGHQFQSQAPPSPAKVASMSAKQKEEEEFQLALAMSLSSQEPHKVKVSPAHNPNVIFDAKALYDFKPTEDGELALRKGDVIHVIDNTTFSDWWKGICDEKVGIFPSNYVSKIDGDALPPTQTNLADPNAQILQHSSRVENFKISITKADPLGHNQMENEKLQREYEEIVRLIPMVLERANLQRKKQGDPPLILDELSTLHERFTTACATFQGIMNSFHQSQRNHY